MEDVSTLFLPKSRFTDLYLNFCGKSTCEPEHSFGPHVRQVYLIHYISKGKGIFKVGKHIYHLQQGQGFLIRPGQLTYYQADEDDPWEYSWIGFGGDKCKEYLSAIGINEKNPIFDTDFGDELMQLVDDMLKLNHNTISNQFKLQSLLFSYLEVLSRNGASSDYSKFDAENKYVQQAVNYIENNFSNEITIQKIANSINIDRSYLFSLFKKERGCSPQQYLTDFRISYAEELLIETDYSVSKICYLCGYKNPETFTKTFKKHVGKAPGQYRKYEKQFHEEQLTKVRNDT
ncbi:MAG: AraC family transcriptional regulator [Holdemanella sp.]|nr:AraC family transcriptional regulator [Holdemanella sp.]